MSRALNAPRPARVRWSNGAPAAVDGEAVEYLRESWLIEDRWWTGRAAAPALLGARRGARGRNVIVFHDLCSGGWFAQDP